LYVRGACGRYADPEYGRSALSAQVEQAAGFAQIDSVESLMELLVDREDEIACPRGAATALMQAGETHGGAQLE
jgi:hypothetical protein